MKTPIVSTLAAGGLLALLGAGTGGPARAVEWHPSTRHWDHHFHAHQDSLRDHRPTAAERRMNRLLGHGAPYPDDPEGFGSR